MGVCARCAGIQAGFLLGSLALALGAGRPRAGRLSPPRPAALALAAAPMGVQWALARLLSGPGEVDGNPVRALTGVVFGAVLSAFVLPAVVEMMEEFNRARTTARNEERIDVATA